MENLAFVIRRLVCVRRYAGEKRVIQYIPRPMRREVIFGCPIPAHWQDRHDLRHSRSVKNRAVASADNTAERAKVWFGLVEIMMSLDLVAVAFARAGV